MQIANEFLQECKEIVCRELFYDSSLGEKCSISYGWPSSKALARKQKALGEAWQQEEREAIFISPWLFKSDKKIDLLGVLIHELIHIKIGNDKGHRGTFKKEMKELGLGGKPTASVVSEELRERLNGLNFPEVPELYFDSSKKKKQGTRLLLLMCKCGRKLRVSNKVANEGTIICGECKSQFELQG